MSGNIPAQQADFAEYSASLLALDAVPHETPRMKLLAWVMSLPDGLDPALAAQAVLAGAGTPALSRALRTLVEIVAEYPLERLAALRRGGRC